MIFDENSYKYVDDIYNCEGKVASLGGGRFKMKDPVFEEQELYLKLEGNAITTTTTHNEIVKDLLKLENQIPIQLLKRVLPKDLDEKSLNLLFFEFCVSVSPLPLPPYESNENFIQSRREIVDQSQHLLHFLYSLLFYQRFSAYAPSSDQRSGSIFVDLLNMMANVLRLGVLQQLVDAVGLIQSLFSMLGKIHHSSPFAIEITSPKFPSASKLKNVGVKFHGGGHGGGFDKQSATLTLPILTINDFCEVILRNLVAFEVEAKLNPATLSHYVKLMSGLIATVNDVRILRRAGIIAGDCSGNEDDVVKMFNELGNASEVSRSDASRATKDSFFDFELRIVEDISGYYESRWMVKAERFMKRYIFPVVQVLMILVVLGLILIVVIRTVCGWFSCPKIMGHSIIKNTAYYNLL